MTTSQDVFLGPHGAQSPRHMRLGRRKGLPGTEQQPLRRHGLRTETDGRSAETCRRGVSHTSPR